MPACWLWSACDQGQISVCKISGHGSISLEHTFSVHQGQMVKSMIWSPSFEGSQVETLNLKAGQERSYLGQTDGLATLSQSQSSFKAFPFGRVPFDEDPGSEVSQSDGARTETEVSECGSDSSEDDDSGPMGFQSMAVGTSRTGQDVVWSASPGHSSISVWDARTCALQLTMSVAQPTVLLRVQDYVWVGCFQRIVVYHRITFAPIWLVTNAHSHLINDMVYSPAANQIWSCANDGLLKCWDPLSFQLVASVGTWVPIDTKVLTLAAVGDSMWSAGFANQILVFNLQSRVLALEFASGHKDSVRRIQVISHSESKGSVIVTGGLDGVLNIWKTSSAANNEETPSAETSQQICTYISRITALDTTLTSIQLASSLLLPKHVSALLDALANIQNSVAALDLSQNFLGDAGAGIISDILPKLPALRSLSLVNNQFTASGFQFIYRGIRQNWMVTQLRLGEFSLDPASIPFYHKIGSCIAANQRLANLRAATPPHTGELSVGSRNLSSVPKLLLEPAWGPLICGLDVSHNICSKLPSSVLSFSNLLHLNVSHNKLGAIPNLSNLPSLQSLDCSNNLIAEIPLSLVRSKCLRSLKASHNRIRSTPLVLGLMPSLQDIDISSNPAAAIGTGTGTTYGTLSSNGTLVSYLQAIQHIPIGLKMVRLALIGSPRSGKTTLVKRLRLIDSPRRKPFSNPKPSSGFRSYYWLSSGVRATTWHVIDFSGEACLQYATHPMLLPDMGMYAVVFDIRLGDDESGIAYWTSCISRIAPSAPIVLIPTHCDLVDTATLQARMKALTAFSTTYQQVRLIATPDHSTIASSDGVSPSTSSDSLGPLCRPASFLTKLAALNSPSESFCARTSALPHRFMALSELILAHAAMHQYFFGYDDFQNLFQLCMIRSSEIPDALRFLQYSGRVVLLDLESGHPPTAGNMFSESLVAIESAWLSHVLSRLTTSETITATPSESNPFLPTASLSSLWDKKVVDPQLLPVMVFLLETLDIGFKADTADSLILPFLLPPSPPSIQQMQTWWQSNSSHLPQPSALAASMAPSPRAIEPTPLVVSGETSEAPPVSADHGESVRFFDFEWVPINLFSQTLIRLMMFRERFKVHQVWKTGILLKTRLPATEGERPSLQPAAGTSASSSSNSPFLNPLSMRRRNIKTTIARFASSASRHDLNKSLQGSNLSNLLASSSAATETQESPLADGLKVSISLNPLLKRLSLAIQGPEYQRSNAFIFFINAIYNLISSQPVLCAKSLVPCPICCHLISLEQPTALEDSTLVSVRFNEPKAIPTETIDSRRRSIVTLLFRSTASGHGKSKRKAQPQVDEPGSPRGQSSVEQVRIPCWDLDFLTAQLAKKTTAYVQCRTCELPTRLDLVAPDIAFSAYQGLMFTPSEVQTLSIIGEGSTAIVTKAQYGKSIVAIKRLLAPDEAEPTTQGGGFPVSIISRFRQEAWMMTVYKHQNVIPLLGVCLQPPTLMLPFMEQGDLYEFIHSKDREIPLPLKFSLIRDITRGLNFLHTLQPPLIHRDLRPPNIFLRFSKKLDRIQAILGDFGLSQLLVFSANHKDDSEFIQNALYCSPETLTHHSFSTQSDIYAWAVVTWELVTRRKPYAECNWMWEVEKLVVQGQHPPVTPEEFPAPLHQLILSAMSIDPADRCSTTHILSILPKDGKFSSIL
ncbi:MAG: protein kinase [archaeon]|nr:protein kinase [archaeon]